VILFHDSPVTRNPISMVSYCRGLRLGNPVHDAIITNSNTAHIRLHLEGMMTTRPANYLISRGLRDTAPEALNEALRVVLESMEPMAYGDATTGLTVEEQAVLHEGGLTMGPTPGPDPLAETVVKFAAIIKQSRSTKEVSKRLGLAPSRVRQMIADRSLYSFLIEGNRYIPNFQFWTDDRLVPNITRVNKALNPRMHPVEVYNWYHLPNVDLFLNDDIDDIVSPLDWLKGGQTVEQLLLLAGRL